jgi:hypothetical protein
MDKKLSIAQKKVLNRYPEVSHILGLPQDVQDNLYKLRDYNTLHSDVTRYLNNQQVRLYGEEK